MSYTPIQWETGNIVTAEKLNQMDEQIANSANALIIEFDGNASSTTTYDEIVEAVNNGRKLYVVAATEYGNQYSEVNEMVLSNGLFVGRCCFTTPSFNDVDTVVPAQYSICAITSVQESFTVLNSKTIDFDVITNLLTPFRVIVSEDVSVAEYVTNKTWREVYAAMSVNRAVFFDKYVHENNTFFNARPIGYSETTGTYRILMTDGYYETDDPDTIMQYHPW